MHQYVLVLLRLKKGDSVDIHRAECAFVEGERSAAERISYLSIDSGYQLDDLLECDGGSQVNIEGRQAGEIIPIA